MGYKECEVCGKSFYVCLSRETTARFCSKDCYNQNRSGNFKYDYDRDFFKKIDSEAKAYFLGFILGDGHISNGKSKMVTIKIQENDEKILKTLIDEIGGDLKQIRHGREGFVDVNIASQEWIKDLNRLGVPSGKKAYIETDVLKNVPKELQNHFIRGIFDADGSVVIDRKRGDGLIYLLVIMSGTKTICSQFKHFCGLKSKISTQKNINGVTHRITKTLTSTEQVDHFISKLYENSTIFLKRKREKFEEYKKIREPYEKGLNKWRKGHLAKINRGVKLYKEGLTPNEIKKKSGLDIKLLIRQIRNETFLREEDRHYLKWI